MQTPPPSFLLRVEGVNIGQTLDDVAQIGTIRGAGMALRDAMPFVEERLRKLAPRAEDVQTLQTGASTGLFRLDTDAKSAKNWRDAIADALDRHPLYRHLTFVVDVQALGDFDRDRERVLARNRFRQLRQLSAIARDNGAAPPDASAAPCPIDGLRPAVAAVKIKGKRDKVSASVQRRFYHGLRAKRRFIRRAISI